MDQLAEFIDHFSFTGANDDSIINALLKSDPSGYFQRLSELLARDGIEDRRTQLTLIIAYKAFDRPDGALIERVSVDVIGRLLVAATRFFTHPACNIRSSAAAVLSRAAIYQFACSGTHTNLSSTRVILNMVSRETFTTIELHPISLALNDMAAVFLLDVELAKALVSRVMTMAFVDDCDVNYALSMLQVMIEARWSVVSLDIASVVTLLMRLVAIDISKAKALTCLALVLEKEPNLLCTLRDTLVNPMFITVVGENDIEEALVAYCRLWAFVCTCENAGDLVERSYGLLLPQLFGIAGSAKTEVCDDEDENSAHGLAVCLLAQLVELLPEADEIFMGMIASATDSPLFGRREAALSLVALLLDNHRGFPYFGELIAKAIGDSVTRVRQNSAYAVASYVRAFPGSEGSARLIAFSASLRNDSTTISDWVRSMGDACAIEGSAWTRDVIMALFHIVETSTNRDLIETAGDSIINIIPSLGVDALSATFRHVVAVIDSMPRYVTSCLCRVVTVILENMNTGESGEYISWIMSRPGPIFAQLPIALVHTAVCMRDRFVPFLPSVMRMLVEQFSATGEFEAIASAITTVSKFFDLSPFSGVLFDRAFEVIGAGDVVPHQLVSVLLLVIRLLDFFSEPHPYALQLLVTESGKLCDARDSETNSVFFVCLAKLLLTRKRRGIDCDVAILGESNRLHRLVSSSLSVPECAAVVAEFAAALAEEFPNS